MGIKTQKKDRTTLWITLAIVLLLAGSILLYAFSATGILARNTTVIETENYEVDAAMITYYENLAYQNVYAQYYQVYAPYASLLGNDVQSYIQNAIANSGINFFQEAVDSLKSILILCEDAKAAGIALDDEDLASIDAEIAEYSGQFKLMFGEGIKASDIRKAMKLQLLASKYLEGYEKESLDAVTEDDINKFVEENKASFYITDYVKAELNVVTEDYADDKEGFAAAKALVDEYYEKLKNVATVDEFKTAMIEYKVKADFNALAKKEISVNLMPEQEELLSHRQAITDNLVKLLVNGETITTEAAEEGSLEAVLLNIEATLRQDCLAMLDAAVLTQNYVEAHEHAEGEEHDHEEPSALALWLSDSDNGEGAKYHEDLSSDEQYSFAVYMITEALHVDDRIAKNVGHLLVEANKSTATEEEIAAAKEKAEGFLAEYLAGEKTKDSFEKIAEKNTADSEVFYTDITDETNFVTEYKNWVLDPARKEGDTGIVQTDYGFHVMYYYETEVTTENAKAGIITEKYNAHIEEKLDICKVNEKAIEKYGK